MPSAYLPLLRTPGAAAFFLSAAAGRVGIAMTGLGLIWLVHARTGSYGTAGLATAGFAVTEALLGPYLARLIDRFGQPRVLPFALVAHGAAIAAVLAARTPAAMIVAATCAGAAVPQLGALTAARWAHLLRPNEANQTKPADRAGELATAFSLESLANATAFLLGPVLVAGLGAAGNPAVASAIAAALILIGGGTLAAQHRTAPPPRKAGTGGGPPAFVPLLGGLHLAVGVYFGTLSVAITAFAVGQGTPGAAAPIILAASLGGLLSGWFYGRRRRRAPVTVQLVAVTAYLTGTALLLPVAPSPVWLGAAAVLTEAAVPPTLVLLAVLTERSVRPAVLTEAFTWNNSSTAAGSAIAAALAGRLADSAGTSAAFALAPAAGLALLALALAAGRVRTR
ncbi:MFS transporter [Paractinoplanes tereljensis]|uniref:MFS transporter n=2 Tax=Paractinoplanes tereljensis TaxID=571912 RepID=A0A919NLU0_9ACTN|nr:MFS transporter [Actinoplanes tereljensis]